MIGKDRNDIAPTVQKSIVVNLRIVIPHKPVEKHVCIHNQPDDNDPDDCFCTRQWDKQTSHAVKGNIILIIKHASIITTLRNPHKKNKINTPRFDKTFVILRLNAEGSLLNKTGDLLSSEVEIFFRRIGLTVVFGDIKRHFEIGRVCVVSADTG